MPLLSDLKPYQTEAVHFLVQNRRCILGDDMGLGKTLDGLYASFEFPERIDSSRMLIACSKNAMNTWRKEIKKWYPEYYDRLVFVRGNKKKRSTMWEQAKSGNCIYVATYGTVLNDIAMVPKFWPHIIGDEAHKLRNRKTKTFEAFKKIKSKSLFLLTGSPMSRGIQNVWALLHLCDPVKWSSYWKFIDTYCIVDFGPFGRDIVGTKNMDLFKIEASKYLLVRKKKDVAKDLPPKIRVFREVELDKATQKIYDSMQQQLMFALDEDSKLVFVSTSTLSSIAKIRQLLVCPKLISPSLGYGAGIEFIIDDIEELELEHVTIFSMFPSAFPYLREYVESRGFKTYEIRGGMEMEEVDESIEGFREHGGICFASIRFAQSYSMEFCTKGYSLGFEWSPDLNEQAEDRLHRMTTTEPVNIDYIICTGTYDENVVDINDEKSLMMLPVIKTVNEYKAIFTKRP